MMDEFRFANDHFGVCVKAHGAELCSLDHRQWGELLWQAGPTWPSHAPNLFPIVGQLVNDALRVGSATYPLARHGFARRRDFTWVETKPDGCTLELHDDAATRAHYPFAFRLAIGYELAGQTLTIQYALTNPGPSDLPASIGAHPAFRWPLADGLSKESHTLTFAKPEPAPVRRLANGLLKTETFPTPVVDRTLNLRDTLFIDDAIIFDRPASTSVRYTAPGAPSIDVAWDGFRELGVWSKPGADFVCIEPWYGYASPVDFDGEFATKPGLLHIGPGETVTLRLEISVGGVG